MEIAATALSAPGSSYSGPLDGDSALYYFYNLKMLNCSAQALLRKASFNVLSTFPPSAEYFLGTLHGFE